MSETKYVGEIKSAPDSAVQKEGTDPPTPVSIESKITKQGIKDTKLKMRGYGAAIKGFYMNGPTGGLKE